VSARPGPDEHRIRLELHYDGSGFAGWQVQPGKRTVQGEIEAALARLMGAARRVVAAGCTETGVHATGQVAGTVVDRRWSSQELRRALNAVLPRDIWVADAVAAADDFHARYHAVARGYVYRLGTADVSRSPFLRARCWPLQEPLALSALNDAAGRFVGRHSYRAFAKTGQPQRGELCTVHVATWRSWEPVGVMLRVVANRFLHHMVRYMVGTMVDIARGRRPASVIDDLLSGAAGVRMSRPAPPDGLYLARVYYPGDEWSADDSDEILS
jgi:tRNA pseudouridine38-40 synthase